MPPHIAETGITKDDITGAILRISKMELLYNLAAYALRSRPDALHSPSVAEAVQALSAYCESGDWLHDYELDEKQLLPPNLKRGVLSQDGLYDLLSAFKEATTKQQSKREVISTERVCEFLKKAGTYYLATVEGDQPRVRPFGTAHIFEGRLYIQTGKVKPVSKQLLVNPKAEICAFKDGKWLRISGELIEDDRVEARKSMLDAYPNLRAMYDKNDGNTQVFFFQNARATFSSFSAPAETIEF